MTPQLLGNAEEHPSDKLAVVHFQPKDVVSFSRVFFCSKRISGISSCRGSLAGGGKLFFDFRLCFTNTATLYTRKKLVLRDVFGNFHVISRVDGVGRWSFDVI